MIDIASVKNAIGNAHILLSDFSDADIQGIISSQEDFIKDYLDTLPDPVPTLIQKICLDFTIFEIYKRQARQDVPESVEKQKQNGYKLLDKILKKEITFGTAEITADDMAQVFSATKRFFSTKL
jgi:hypothetical protein